MATRPTGRHRRPRRAGRAWGPGRPGRGGERGSIALEMAFAAPIVLLLLALAWTYGRVAWANGHLEAGARDAARVATQSRSAEEARANALAVVQENTAAVAGCGESAAVLLTGSFEPGSTLTVRASCSYSLSDIGLPGAPGTMTPTATFSSVIDQRRGIAP
ncbi:TadE family protein [Ornithinimicrobium sufpigmenti]|uniref:TadE family protein n=1 Tax=Ornithinimicrobium sufpigmenti TaxID=2508882 RepID=UPI001035986E|nr:MULTISPECIES: TadE family protein [unclassified Ornithinimicrobium]